AGGGACVNGFAPADAAVALAQPAAGGGGAASAPWGGAADGVNAGGGSVRPVRAGAPPGLTRSGAGGDGEIGAGRAGGEAGDCNVLPNDLEPAGAGPAAAYPGVAMRAAKKGSSSAMAPSGRDGPSPRDSRSLRPTLWPTMARCSSRSVPYSSRFP